MREERDYSLLAHNTFGIDARCRRFVEFASIEEAKQVAMELKEPFLIIGGGSNLLLTHDYDGTVVRSAIQGVTVVADDGDMLSVKVGSGNEWDATVGEFVRQGWHGAENLSLIPGDVGASAVQNIGAYGTEVCRLIEQVDAVSIGDGSSCTFTAEECQYGYRQSRFKNEWKNRYLITNVTYRLSRRFEPNLNYAGIQNVLSKHQISQPTAQQLRDCIIGIRNEKLPDPKVEGNAGSFFMNPVIGRQQFNLLLERYPDMPHYYVDDAHEKIPAGWMIEQCGWKGRTVGRAGVHCKQALVLVNRGGATGKEIVDLCNAIRRDVKEQFNIEIIPEVNII